MFEIIRSHPLKRKVLLVRSHAQGQMLLEQVSRVHGPVLNTEVRTVRAWVLERVKLLLTQNVLRFLAPSESSWVVCRILQSEAKSGADYLHGITISPGVTHVFHQAVMDLRRAGITAESLNIVHFENEEKGRFVKRLLHLYEVELKEKRQVDVAGLLSWARQLPPMDNIAIVDEDAVQTALDRQLLQALTGGSYIALAKEPAFNEADSLFPIDQSEFFHATGVVAEVREVFRRVTEKTIPWDQIELVLCNYEQYAAAVHTVSSGAGIRCTYSDGLPISLTNAGKAAKLFLDWIESGYNIDYMLLALKQGYIRLTDEHQDTITTGSLIRELERTGIGWGKERYQLLEKRASAEASNDETIGVLRVLQTFFQKVFGLLTGAGGTLSSPHGLFHALSNYLSSYAVLKDECDQQVLSGLKGVEQSLTAAGEFEMDEALALQYVRDGLDRLRVQVSGTPSPGFIHVTSLASGGQTGRPYSCIIGMSEKNWMVSARQDPVLLDEERVRIHPELITSTDRVQRSLQQRGRRIGMIRGKCVLSFCSYDAADGHEQMPAYELLQLYRRNTGESQADYETMRRSLAEGVGFAGNRSRLLMDAADIWMRALLSNGSQIKDGSKAVYASYSHLADGSLAVHSRMEMSLTPYDGLVDTSGYPVTMPDAGANQAFSASKLELYARCPLQYFYHDILRVRAKDVAAFDRSQWLNPLDRGTLMHEIFNRYFTEMKDRRLRSSDPLTHDYRRLCELTEQVIVEFAVKIPAPSTQIFRKECDSIRKDVSIFYANEKRKTSIPVYMELQLHRDDSPMILELSDELTLPIRGYVDRVDQVGPHQYKIYDYKTGNPRRYRQNDCFAGGTQLQLPLYGAAVEQWMRQSGYDPEARVVDSAYYFPTEKGMGEEVSRPQNRRQDLVSLVRTMQAAMKSGLFPPTNEPKNCTWCDYSVVCGAHAEHFSAKSERPENGERLAPVLEVRRFD